MRDGHQSSVRDCRETIISIENEGVRDYVPVKCLNQNADPDYYNSEIKK